MIYDEVETTLFNTNNNNKIHSDSNNCNGINYNED